MRAKISGVIFSVPLNSHLIAVHFDPLITWCHTEERKNKHVSGMFEVFLDLLKMIYFSFIGSCLLHKDLWFARTTMYRWNCGPGVIVLGSASASSLHPPNPSGTQQTSDISLSHLHSLYKASPYENFAGFASREHNSPQSFLPQILWVTVKVISRNWTLV